MKNLTITSESADAVRTLLQNKPGVMTPILEIAVQDGQRLFLANQTTVNGQTYQGATIVMELRDTAGNIIRDGNFQVATRLPLSEYDQPMRALPLTIHAPYSTKEQKNAQYKGSLAQACDLNIGPGVVLQNRAKLIISIQSAAQIDWTKSYFEMLFTEVNG